MRSLELCLPVGQGTITSGRHGPTLLPILGLLPGLLLVHRGAAAFFAAHRERLLLATWAWLGLGAGAHLRSTWVAVLGLALPIRFWKQAPLSLLLALPQLLATRPACLKSLCSVALPLACTYCCERHMRRSFVRAWQAARDD